MSNSDIRSTDPVTGELLWSGPAADVDAAVAAARAAFPGWSRTPLPERIAILRAYETTVRQAEGPLARLIARETGKPFWEARAEVASVAAKVGISIDAYGARTGERLAALAGATQAVRHRPHGVLAVLGPYNFPAHLPNGHVVPALLAGNSVVFKPSELTPATGEALADLWGRAGLPDGVLTVAQGGAEVGRALVGHAGVDGILFTGSATTGTAIHRALAGRPERMLALEMGGNNPLVIWDLQDRSEAGWLAVAALVIQSAFLSAGQRCTCARRLILRDDDAAPLLDLLLPMLDRLIVGAPFDEPQPFMGPVIDNRAADALMAGYEGLLAVGGRAIRPLQRPDGKRPFLTPAIIDMSEARARPDEELFGPLLQLVRVPDFEAALAEARATRFGLAAALVGGDRALYDRFWEEVRAGVVNWNRPTTGAASSAPFGGVGLSGNHRPSAYYAADYSAFPVAGIEAPAPVPPAMTGLGEAAR